MQGDHLGAGECYLAMLAMDEYMQTMNVKERTIVVPIEVLEYIPLDVNNPGRYSFVGAIMEH